MLPDEGSVMAEIPPVVGLNAPTGAWCSLTVWAARWARARAGLNAPTGAWCSLTGIIVAIVGGLLRVSMHLQVRGAP